MNAPEQFSSAPLPDVQSQADKRAIEIQKVGIRGLRHPINVLTPDGIQSTVATVDMTVSLEASVKGTHMSRFVEVFQENKLATSTTSLINLGNEMLKKLEASTRRCSVMSNCKPCPLIRLPGGSASLKMLQSWFTTRMETNPRAAHCGGIA